MSSQAEHRACLRLSLSRGARMAQSIERLSSAQIMISRFVGLSPASGSVLTAQSLMPVSDSVSPSLSASLSCAVSLCLKNKQKKI